MHKTEAALIARGFDQKQAQSLRSKGMTLAKMQLFSDSALKALGLSSNHIERLRSKRPPIPISTLISVCAKSRWVCCVCKDRALSIILHHIKPWATSHDHAEENLAVLCLHHHGEAHTKHDTTINLSPQKIRKAKQRWEQQVLDKDSEALHYQPIFENIQWLYFNHRRMFAMADDLGIDLCEMDGYDECVGLNLVTQSGDPIARPSKDSWMYRGGYGTTLYRYCKAIMEAIWYSSAIIDLSDHFDQDEIPARTQRGLIYVQGAYTFSRQPDLKETQATQGCRSANRVRVTFTFDRGEATSCSAWSEWLRGRKNVGCVLRVHNINMSESKTNIEATVIGICMPINGLAARRYDDRLWASGAPYRREEEE